MKHHTNTVKTNLIARSQIENGIYPLSVELSMSSDSTDMLHHYECYEQVAWSLVKYSNEKLIIVDLLKVLPGNKSE